MARGSSDTRTQGVALHRRIAGDVGDRAVCGVPTQETPGEPAERGEDQGLSRVRGRRSSGGRARPSPASPQQVWGPTLNSRAVRPRREQGSPGRSLTGPAKGPLPPWRVIGSGPGGRWLGRRRGRSPGKAGRQLTEYTGRAPGALRTGGRAGGQLRSLTCGDRWRNTSVALCARLCPLVWLRVVSRRTSITFHGRCAPQREARLTRHGKRDNRCRAPSARLDQN